ncbi:hypothetical protein K504DRAFT_506319 [Pleomassaria siparia CBS 279.74]|uniref:Uncharacterized protein n=1 Tax=Pleomassaria siparia CBS 279.74 TaxID=1314801 RepID=A0A6G1JXV4_9PLEO|nr:hypothetical protein K504DRAFT_506319 [Pleomassaria siparia CBS 279.74]
MALHVRFGWRKKAMQMLIIMSNTSRPNWVFHHKSNRTRGPLGDADDGLYDFEKGRFIYPYMRPPVGTESVDRNAASQDLDGIKKSVEAVLACLDADIGNIVPLLVQDLSTLAAREERELLPRIDYAHAVFKYDITEEAKEMLRNKMERAQMQYAHDLMEKGMIDIVITWYCGDDPERTGRVVFVPPEQAETMQQAWEMSYKCLDGDVMHARSHPRIIRSKGQPDDDDFDDDFYTDLDDLCEEAEAPRIEEDLPIPNYLGGFYACVSLDLIPALSALQDSWKIDITTVIAPQLMTEEQRADMDEYYASRRSAEEEMIKAAEKELEIERPYVEREVIKRHKQRKARTYGNVVEESWRNFKAMNLDEDGRPRSPPVLFPEPVIMRDKD